jgi:hypothetical protein
MHACFYFSLRFLFVCLTCGLRFVFAVVLFSVRSLFTIYSTNLFCMTSNNIVTRNVTVDGVLDWQLDLLDHKQLHTITMYTLQLTRLDS